MRRRVLVPPVEQCGQYRSKLGRTLLDLRTLLPHWGSAKRGSPCEDAPVEVEVIPTVLSFARAGSGRLDEHGPSGVLGPPAHVAYRTGTHETVEPVA
jgi:hypothetical protein